MKLIKKSLSAVLIVMMLLTSVYLQGFAGVTVKAAGDNCVTDGYKREHVLKRWEKLNQSYKSDYLSGCAVPMDGTNGNPDYLVPGQAENMIPQGLTYWPEKDWLLISSYDKNEENASVIFALDRKTGDFAAQFNLYTADGEPWMCHAGGIGVSEYNLYITSDCGVAYFPLTDLDAENGTVYGEVSDVAPTGANDIYCVLGEDKKETWIPAITQVISKVDIDGGVLEITPMKGLFDDED